MHLVSLVIIFFLASSQGINLLSDSDTHLYSSSKEIEGANTIALTLHRWIVSIPPPGDEKITKNAWKVCFSIFLRYLLPTAIAFFGLMQMFSAEPPSYVLIEKLGKRLFIAILIAYFGFTVVDFMCKLTNFIGELIIKSLSSNGYFSLAELMMLLLPSSLLAIIGSTSASSLAILPVLSTFISSITTFLILVFVLLFTRIAVVHITAALLPIFCFFIIIGIGPFKKLKEIAELIFAIGLITPIFSIVGAFLLAFVERAAFRSIPLAIGSLVILLSFPYFALQSAGIFQESLSWFGTIYQKLKTPIKGFIATRFTHHSQIFGSTKAIATSLLPIPTIHLVKGIRKIKKPNEIEKIASKIFDVGYSYYPFYFISKYADSFSTPGLTYKVLSIPLKVGNAEYVLKKYGYGSNLLTAFKDAMKLTINSEKNSQILKNLYTFLMVSQNYDSLKKFIYSKNGRFILKTILRNPLTRGFINSLLTTTSLDDIELLSLNPSSNLIFKVSNDFKKINLRFIPLNTIGVLNKMYKLREELKDDFIAEVKSCLKKDLNVLENIFRPKNKNDLIKIAIKEIYKPLSFNKITSEKEFIRALGGDNCALVNIFKKLSREYSKKLDFDNYIKNKLLQLILESVRSNEDVRKVLAKFIEGGGYIIPKNRKAALKFLQEISKALKMEYLSKESFKLNLQRRLLESFLGRTVDIRYYDPESLIRRRLNF